MTDNQFEPTPGMMDRLRERHEQEWALFDRLAQAEREGRVSFVRFVEQQQARNPEFKTQLDAARAQIRRESESDHQYEMSTGNWTALVIAIFLTVLLTGVLGALIGVDPHVSGSIGGGVLVLRATWRVGHGRNPIR